MIKIETIYIKRKNEISQYLTYIKLLLEGKNDIHLNKNNKLRANSYVSSTLKASTFVMLYNLIESTVSRSIELIHNTITSENLTYAEVNHQVQSLWREYYLSKQNKSINKIADHLISGAFSKEQINIEFNEYVNKKKIFSGNLDVSEIRVVASSYGFAVRNKRPGDEKILLIKSIRNKLSHGEISFSECGRDYVVDDLYKISNTLFNFLEYFINQVADYLINKKYMSRDANAQSG